VGSAILAVFGDYNPATLDGLMEHINVAVAGSDAIDGEESDEAPDLSAEPAAKEATPPPPKEAAPAAPAGGVVNVSDNEVADLFDNLLAEESSDKKKEEAPAAPAPVAEKPAPAAAPAGGVVNVSDDEMTDLFDNLLSEDSADKKREKAEADAAAAAAAAAKPEPPAAKPGGLLNVSDNEVSDLFDNLLGGEAEPAAKKSMDFTPAEKAAEAEAAPAAPAAEAAPTAEAAPRAEAEAEAKPEKEEDKKKKIAADSKPPKQIKEFGKLSVQASAKDTGGEAGAMKAIGRQLIDVQAVENIIKAGEKREKIGSGLTTARVISAARGEGIKTLLSKIDTFEGVIGSLIVGHDGLVIASTLSGGIDKDMMGAMCTAIHSHLDVAVKKMDKGKLQQSVFVGGDNKLTVMTAVAVGVLAVFVDNAGVEKVDGLLTAIDNTVRG
jgi:predicted regulator of Ras-like GTPase activity (Roadblock/LC7/MglB family)